jgi:type I restriction enzyme, S subunit
MILERLIPSGWRATTFDSLKQPGKYTFIGGPFGSNLTSRDYVSTPGVPVIRGTNLDGKRSEFLDHGFVYVSTSKAAALRCNLAFPGDMIFTQRGTLGQVGIIPDDAVHSQYVVSQSQMKLTVDATQAEAKYLYHYYRSPFATSLLNQRVLATGVPHINLEILKTFPVLLPPLAEQRRIAAILDRADAIRRKHREAIAVTEQLLRSTFMHSVGSLHPAHQTWPCVSIEELAGDHRGAIRSGPFGSALKHSEFVDDGIAVLGIDNAVTNRFTWGERRYITRQKYEQLRQYRVFPGDVIITIMGTTGRSAVVPDDIQEAITTKHLATITLERSRAFPEYISRAIHTDEHILRQIVIKNRGAIMAGLNLGVIKELAIRLPPLPIQRRFVEQAQSIEVLRTRLMATQNESDNLFHSLVQRAFRGDL